MKFGALSETGARPTLLHLRTQLHPNSTDASTGERRDMMLRKYMPALDLHAALD